MNTTQFIKWLRAEIQALAVDDPADNHYVEAVATMKEARQYALSLGLPEVVKICERVKIPVLSLLTAQRLLSECLAAIGQPREHLTVKEASEQLGVSQRTIYDLVRSGRLSCQRFGNGRGTIRFRASDLTNYRAEADQPKFKHLRL